MENEYHPIGELYTLIQLCGEGVIPHMSEITVRLNNGNFVYTVSYGVPNGVTPKFFRKKDKNGLNKEAEDLQDRLLRVGLKPISDKDDERNFSRRIIYIDN